MPPSPPHSPEQVTDLILAMARRDEAAVAALDTAMRAQLRAVATRFTGSPSDGEEMAQDTLLKAWENAANFDPARGTGRAWLFAILRNTARDRLRRRRIRWLVGLDELIEEMPDPGPGSDDQLAARQDLARVRRALGDLPDRQRMALLLVSIAGLETPEIADILGTSRGAVEQLLVRARARLREKIERQ